MKTRIAVLVAVAFVTLAVRAPCHAYWVTPFRDTDSFIKQSNDIVVAKSVPKPKGAPMILSDQYLGEVEVLMTLKGQQKPGPLQVVAIKELKPGTTYLLASESGTFRAGAQLSIVPLPANYDLAVLKGMTTKQQVQHLFAAHLFELQAKLAPLEAERALLLSGLQGRTDNLYESRRDVQIATINETSPQVLSKSTEYAEARYYLELGSAKVEWSPYWLVPTESGELYYRGVGKDSFSWEFAASPQREIKDFDGKPLKARFDGYFSPLDAAPPRSVRGDCIVVKDGQVVLARTTADPRTVYILKIEGQAKDAVLVKYAVVCD